MATTQSSYQMQNEGAYKACGNQYSAAVQLPPQVQVSIGQTIHILLQNVCIDSSFPVHQAIPLASR